VPAVVLAVKLLAVKVSVFDFSVVFEAPRAVWRCKLSLCGTHLQGAESYVCKALPIPEWVM
jgi:hypothetical protein